MATVIDTATVIVANNGEPSGTTCICCAKLERELEETRKKLRSTQEIVELLLEEMSSDALEVKCSTIGGGIKNSGSDCPLDGYTWLQEQRNLLSDITEETKVNFKVDKGHIQERIKILINRMSNFSI
jgi:hypothetical protein